VKEPKPAGTTQSQSVVLVNKYARVLLLGATAVGEQSGFVAEDSGVTEGIVRSESVSALMRIVRRVSGWALLNIPRVYILRGDMGSQANLLPISATPNYLNRQS
jgi:hypothetical protein